MELGLRVSCGFSRAHNLDADAHATTEGGFIVRADEKLSAFLELQRAIHKFAVDLML